MNLNPYLDVNPEVAAAVAAGKPVVALESTIISHGMPYPQNVETALRVEETIRENGAVKMRGADVVEEEERFGTLDEDVVDAVVDEVLADGRVLLREAGDLELGAYAVRAPDKEHVLAGRCEEPAEVADSPD